MTRPLSLRFPILCGLALGLWLQLLQPSQRPLSHDESITLLGLAGHQRDYRPPHPGDPHPPSEVRGWLTPDDQRDTADLLVGLARADVHPPLYFALARGWLLLRRDLSAADQDRWLRALSGLFIWGAAAGLALSGLRRLEHRPADLRPAGLSPAGLSPAGLPSACAALGAATWLALGPWPQRYAHRARPYGLLIALAAVATILALRQVEQPRVRRGALLGVLLGALLLTHYLAAPLVLALGLGPALALGALGLAPALGRARARPASPPRRPSLGLLLPLPLALLLAAPWWFYAWRSSGLRPPRHLARPAPPLVDQIHALGQMLVRYLGWENLPPDLARPLPWLLAVGWLGIGLAFLASLRRTPGPATGSRPPSGARPRALLFGLSWLAPLALPLAHDLLRGGRLIGHPHSAATWGPAAAAVLGGWLGPRVAQPVGTSTRRLALPLALLLVASQAGPLAVYGARRLRWDGHRPWQATHERLQAAADAGERLAVVVTADARGQFPRRARYLPPRLDGRILMWPADGLASADWETLTDGAEHLLLLGFAAPCCGGRLPAMNGARARAAGDALRAAGWQSDLQFQASGTGWALWSRSPAR